MLKFAQKVDKSRPEKLKEIREYIINNITRGVFVQRKEGCIAMIAPVDGAEPKLFAWVMLRYGTSHHIYLMPENRGIDKIAKIIFESGWEFVDATLTLENP